MPSTTMPKERFAAGLDIVTLLSEVNLVKSRSEARRLIDQGGITLGQERVESIDRLVTVDDFDGSELIIRKGKKVYHRVVLE